MRELMSRQRWGRGPDGDHGTQDRAPERTNPTAMKHRILRSAAEFNIPVTIRKIPRGLLVWRSTDEDLHQATEVSQRLQVARKPPRTGYTPRHTPTWIAQCGSAWPWEISDNEVHGESGDRSGSRAAGRDDQNRAGA